jgi:tungstate transport system substrate-binding protein
VKSAAAIFIIATLSLSMLNACDKDSKQFMRVGVTTSTRDSGLLKELLPAFEEAQNVEVQVIAVGTGKALKLGQLGEVDALIVHAEKSELAFMSAGFGSRRVQVMVNYFILAGPREDPAKVRNLGPLEALQQIQKSQHKFISRGDNSGTHKKELLIWGQTKRVWENYIESGQGMGRTLIMADQLKAYTLTDIGTFLKMKSKVELIRLSKDHPPMKNPYGAMVINPKRHPKVKAQLANKLLDFLISQEAQKKIGGYQINNQALFTPLHLNTKKN